ncbi:hypothetical protein RJ639_032899 [Escallonia herrerae]|uniref:Uncharacterized protein n=1 Tax=Escallonia herrerae TaxID=1293975 RepID=A0AA89BAV5_9ASTE|nr:hypothetical protein RJ639_032899 [Escallonia herrerae]
MMAVIAATRVGAKWRNTIVTGCSYGKWLKQSQSFFGSILFVMEPTFLLPEMLLLSITRCCSHLRNLRNYFVIEVSNISILVTKESIFHLSWINISLSEAVLPVVVGHNTAASAWAALSQAFGAASDTHVLQLLMQFHNTKRDDKPVATYLQEMKYLADQLGAAGKLLSPVEFNAIIFNNLGSDFYPAVAAFSSHPTPVS